MKRRTNDTTGKTGTRSGIIATMLCMGLMLSGCGSREAETVTDYGGDGRATVTTEVGTGTEEQGSTEGTSGEPLDRDAALAAAEAKSNQTLQEKLGGEEVSYQESFSIGQIPVSMDLRYEVPDITALPSYRVTTPSGKLLPEEEIVKNLFGDSATEVKRALSLTKGDSERVLGDAATCYYELFPDKYDPEAWNAGTPDCSAWEDDRDSFYHTYEGSWQGTDYQLLIGKVGDDQILSFYPKNPGALIGRPELSRVLLEQEGTVHYADPLDRSKDYELSLDQLGDATNQTTGEPSTLLASAGDFLKGKMLVSLPEDAIVLTSFATFEGDISGGVTMSDGDGKLQGIVYANPEDLSRGSLGNAVINGYMAHTNYTLSGLGYASVFESGDQNTGSFWLADGGVIGMTLYLTYNFEEKLSENVPLLSFENAMASFRNEVAEELDMSKVTGSSITVDYADLAYYAVTSPEKKGEATYVPVWVIPMKSNNYEFAYALVNAMDGSVVGMQYRADEG